MTKWFKLYALIKFDLYEIVTQNICLEIQLKFFHQIEVFKNSKLQVLDEGGKYRSVSPEIPKIEEPGMYIMVNSIVEFIGTIFLLIN